MNALAKFTPEDVAQASPGSAGELMPRATVETIVRQRNLTLELYGKAHAALIVTNSQLGAAVGAFSKIRARENAYNYHSHNEKVGFLGKFDLSPRKDYLAAATRLVDIEVWAHVIEITDLERIMDKQAKEALRKDLMDKPPEVTVDNIYATLDQFRLDAGMIFRRGIANAFSNLDRRFRSHDGFKIGGRMILDRYYGENGFQNYHRDMESTLLDIERTFMLLDGQKQPDVYAGIAGGLRASRYTGSGCRQGEVHSEFFKVNVYKNGNCHVWFKRHDLVEKVNKLLAEYYGEVIPDGMTPEDDGGLFTPKTSLAKNYGFFPTPAGPAEDVIKKLDLHRDKGEPALTVLEPSAGTGNLARLCTKRLENYEWVEGNAKTTYRYQALVDCVEIQADLADALRATDVYRKVTCCDFLALKPDPTNLYDRVVMNPPFDRERDIDHVMHALEFLKPDGQLVAIMSAGTEFRETRKSKAFRDLMQKMGAQWKDLPAGSFSEAGTNVNTLMISVWNDGRKTNRWW